MKRVSVTVLPSLDLAAFPPLPPVVVPEQNALYVGASTLKKAEKEWLLSVLATAALREGRWVMVDLATMLSIFPLLAPAPFFQDTINVMWQLAEEGQIIIYRLEETGYDYIAPTPEFVRHLDGARLMLAA